jgi:gliding motility-associated-like protein
MLVRIFIFLLLPVCCFKNTVMAQQANIWYFGRGAGIDFNSGTPVALTNSAMVWAPEGSASICDSSGKLLFYTEGTTVWNKNHQIMLNGSGLNGSTSAIQSSLIVPKPGSKSQYYLFTCDADNGINPKGYCYSTVDMLGDNGRGAIVLKNILLHRPETEKLTAIKHANGTDYWIILKERNLNNRFRVYRLSCNGISLSAVYAFNSGFFNTPNTYGFLKFSPDGKTLIDVTPHWNEFAGDNRTGFALYKFNTTTGVISDNIMIPVNLNSFHFYGAEFSPNSQLVYVSGAGALMQFRIDNYELLSIKNSMVELSSARSSFTSSLQLAPNGKIYVSFVNSPEKDSLLGAIKMPDVYGIGCQYQEKYLHLGGKRGLAGLPNFPVNIVIGQEINFTYTAHGDCNTFLFSGITNLSGSLTWEWDFGDGTTGQGQQVLHTFPGTASQYKVTLNINNNNACPELRTKTVTVPITSQMASADFNVIPYCSTPSVRFINTSTGMPVPVSSYRWDFGDGSFSQQTNPPDHSYNNFGTYTVRLEAMTNDPCGTTGIMEKTFTLSPEVNRVSAGNDTSLLRGSFFQLNGTGGIDCRWIPATGLSSPAVCNPVVQTNTGGAQLKYYMTAVTGANCVGTDSIKIQVLQSADIYVPTAFTPNNDGLNDFLFPILIGVKELSYFRVYDRWGNIVFTSRANGDRWNGRLNGVNIDTGVFIWTTEGVTVDGRVIQKKGTVTLLR